MKRIKTGGRRAGTPNKATGEVRDLARSYAPEAVKELARLAKGAESEAARISAIGMILDRAYGKPTQDMRHSGAVGTFDLSKLSDDDLVALQAILVSLAGAEGAREH